MAEDKVLLELATELDKLRTLIATDWRATDEFGTYCFYCGMSQDHLEKEAHLADCPVSKYYKYRVQK